METKANSGGRSRRNVLRILAIGGAAVAAWRLGLFERSTAGAVTRTESLMGTSVQLTVAGDDRDSAEAAAKATVRRMRDLEALLTRYRDDSEVGRLNLTGRVEGASRELRDVLGIAGRISELGDGAFDVSVLPVLEAYREARTTHNALPTEEAIARALEQVDYRAIEVSGDRVILGHPGMRITLDGIGKGYVVDGAVASLRERGFENVFVEAGGDLMAAGERGADEPWRVGIRDPRSAANLQARFDTRDRAVATSGDYMQPFTEDFAQHHILDPRTGVSAPELASSTVIAPDAATADGLATLTMVLGARRSRELIEGLPDCEGYFVSKTLEVTRTGGFELL